MRSRRRNQSGFTIVEMIVVTCIIAVLASVAITNIGNGTEISIGDLAATIKKMTGSDSPIVKIPYDQAYEAGFEDMPRRVPDISKIRALIGYEPTVELDEILSRVIASLRDA